MNYVSSLGCGFRVPSRASLAGDWFSSYLGGLWSGVGAERVLLDALSMGFGLFGVLYKAYKVIGLKRNEVRSVAALWLFSSCFPGKLITRSALSQGFAIWRLGTRVEGDSVFVQLVKAGYIEFQEQKGHGKYYRMTDKGVSYVGKLGDLLNSFMLERAEYYRAWCERRPVDEDKYKLDRYALSLQHWKPRQARAYEYDRICQI